MKKIILIAFVLCALMFAFTSCIPGKPEFTFELRDADSYTVSVANANNARKIVIPDTYNGKPVTAIKQYGFADIKTVRSIVVPDSIDYIGSGAFANCIRLEEVVLGKSVKTLNGIKVLGTPEEGFSAVMGIDQTSENTVTDMVYILMSSIEGMFPNCGKLVSIEVSAENENYKSVDGNLYTKDGTILIKYCGGKKDKSFTIPDGVTKFFRSTFENSKRLEKIVLPNSLEEYKGDNDYTWIFGGTCFSELPSLEEIVVSESNPNYKVLNGNLYTKDGTILIKYCSGKKDKNFTIPDGVEAIDVWAFYHAYNLSIVTVSSSVNNAHFPPDITEIKVVENNTTYKSVDGVLYSKDGKTLINYPRCKPETSYTTIAGVETIGASAFYDVENLKTLIIGDSVKTLEENAITSCNELEKISLGNGVTSIDLNYGSRDSFGFNDKLKYNEYDGAYYLGNDSNPYVLLVMVKDTGIENLTINDKTKFVYSGAFEGCSRLRSITVPDGIISIGESAFAGCKELQSITLPSGITKIEANLFSGCESLENVVIPESVTEIGSGAFQICKSLKSVTLPSGITKIETWLFAECESLENIVIPESVTEIGSDAFRNCISLKNVTLPSGITKLDHELFYECISLESMVVPEGVTEIGKNAFSGCRNLCSITIPESVTEIGSGAFQNCFSLKNVTLPSGITKIKSQLFSGCESLESIVIPEGVTEIAGGVFNRCNNLSYVVLPSTLEKVDENAFVKCERIETVYFTGSEEQWNKLNITVNNAGVQFDYNY